MIRSNAGMIKGRFINMAVVFTRKLVVFLFSLEHSNDNFAKTGVCANHKAYKTNNDNEGVSHHQPNFLRTLHFVPMSTHLNPGRKCKTEGRKAESAKQGDK